METDLAALVQGPRTQQHLSCSWPEARTGMRGLWFLAIFLLLNEHWRYEGLDT